MLYVYTFRMSSPDSLLIRFADERRQVSQALATLDARLERLIDALLHRSTWLSVQGARDDRDALRRVADAYTTITYALDEEAGTTNDCLGVVGAHNDIVKCAEAVNAAKAALREVCAPLQRVFVRVPVKGEGGSDATRPIPAIRMILRSLQRSDLNLLAAYRKIPILAAPPASVTYTRARTRAVYRKTIDEITELLAHLESPDALRDRARLAVLARSERHLALAREHYENIRANVLYRRLDRRGRGRVQIAAELPILYPVGRAAGEPPTVRFPPSAQASEPEPGPQTPSRVRSSKLEDQPCLASLPVYRYRRTH